MESKLNFKIIGSGPTGILLAIALSKLNLNIFLTDLLSKEKLIHKEIILKFVINTLIDFLYKKSQKPKFCFFLILNLI